MNALMLLMKASKAYEKIAKGLLEDAQMDIYGKVGIAQIFIVVLSESISDERLNAFNNE